LSSAAGGGKEQKKETQLGLSTKKADDFSNACITCCTLLFCEHSRCLLTA
jgi:hypothetical protein